MVSPEGGSDAEISGHYKLRFHTESSLVGEAQRLATQGKWLAPFNPSQSVALIWDFKYSLALRLSF